MYLEVTKMFNQGSSIDLFKMFQGATTQLQKNKVALNQADEYNHDHGDNMVDTFEVITRAMKEKQGADPADQLAYASEILRQRKSGSSQLYAGGLAQASQQFQGQQVTSNNAMTLIQTLMGGGQQQAEQPQGGIGDLLGGLLGGNQQPASQQQGGVGDLLGGLLGGSNSQSPSQNQNQNPGIDMGDLLQAGLSFMNTKPRGGSNLEAIVNAVVSGSASNSGYRTQSGGIVVNALMQAVKGMAGNR
jgi:hypothetical protein